MDLLIEICLLLSNIICNIFWGSMNSCNFLSGLGHLFLGVYRALEIHILSLECWVWVKWNKVRNWCEEDSQSSLWDGLSKFLSFFHCQDIYGDSRNSFYRVAVLFRGKSVLSLPNEQSLSCRSLVFLNIMEDEVFLSLEWRYGHVTPRLWAEMCLVIDFYLMNSKRDWMKFLWHGVH